MKKNHRLMSFKRVNKEKKKGTYELKKALLPSFTIATDFVFM